MCLLFELSPNRCRIVAYFEMLKDSGPSSVCIVCIELCRKRKGNECFRDITFLVCLTLSGESASSTWVPYHFDRVATVQRKQGIWMFIFPDRENTANLPKYLYMGNFPQKAEILKVLKINFCTKFVSDITTAFWLCWNFR